MTAPAVIVDQAAREPGRGCWLHEQPSCLDRATQRRAISRALRLAEPVDLAALTEWFAKRGQN